MELPGYQYIQRFIAKSRTLERLIIKILPNINH